MSSIPQRIGAYQQTMDAVARTGEFLQVARAILCTRTDRDGRDFLKLVHATDRARQAFEEMVVARTAVPAGTTYDSAWAGSLTVFQASAAAFLESLSNNSALDRLLADGAPMRVPPLTTVRISTAAAVAAQVDEAAPSKATALSFTSVNVSMTKVIAFLTASAELLRAMGPGPLALFGRELSKAVGRATDAYLISRLMVGVTPIAQTGPNSRADLKSLMAAVSFGADARLYYVTTPALAKNMSLAGADNAMRMFPGMNLGGNATLDGVPVLVSDSATAGTLTLFDASQVAVSAGALELDRSNVATLQLDSAPDSPPLATSPYVSLFQSDMSALRATRYLGISKLRTAAAGQLTGVTA